MPARIWNHRRNILIGIGVFAVLFLLPYLVTHAQSTTTPAWYEDPIGHIQRMIFGMVLSVFGGLMTLCGYAFDYTIANFIIGFGDLYLNSNLGYIIDDLWSTIRDLFNLGLIFGVVFIGMKLIFNADDSGAQKMLGSLILAALLVNFSLFIVKFIIDFTNVLAAQIYGAFVAGDAGGTIGTTFVNLISLSNMLNTEANVALLESGGWLFIFGVMILFLVTAFVFAAGAFLITIRYIALNLYMVFSPLMFLGWVFPKMGRYSADYWHGFMGKAFFAPAFIFMIYLSFQVVQKYGEGRTIAMNQLFANGPGSIVETSGETFAFFILCIGFMISSLVVANKMGATGASATIALGQRLRRSGQRMATQPGRYIARNVVNKTGLAAERRFNQLQNSNPNSRLGKMVAKAARGTSMDEFVRGTTAKAKGAKFGLATTVSDNRKRNTEIQSRFTGAENARNAAYSLNELTNIREREKLDALNAKYAAGIAAGTPATNILTAEENSQRTALTAAYAGHTGLTAADLARKAELELKESEHRNNATGLSQAQLETLSDTERAAIAPYLSHSQVEKLGDSKELSDEQKQQLKDARTNTVKMLVESGIQDVTKLSIEQLEMMGENFIKDQAQKGNLKQSQVDDLKKSKKFTELQRDSFGKIHAAAQGAKALGKATSGAIPFSRLTNNELETIGKDALISSGAIYQLSKSQLDDLKKGKLSDDEKRDLDNARTQFITNTVTQSNAAGFDLLMQGKKADDVAELGINVLSHRLGIERLDINVLESMITKKRPPTDRDVLRAEIERIATNPTMPPDPLQPHATILANFLNSPRGLRF